MILDEEKLIELLKQNLKVSTHKKRRSTTHRSGGDYYGTTYHNEYTDLVTEVHFGDILISSTSMELKHHDTTRY